MCPGKRLILPGNRASTEGPPKVDVRPQAEWCAPGRIRTCDTRFRRAVLYPLSYEGMYCQAQPTG